MKFLLIMTLKMVLLEEQVSTSDVLLEKLRNSKATSFITVLIIEINYHVIPLLVCIGDKEINYGAILGFRKEL